MGKRQQRYIFSRYHTYLDTCAAIRHIPACNALQQRMRFCLSTKDCDAKEREGKRVT